MALLIVALFIAVPFAELAVIVAAADAFGLGWTFLALVVASVAGAVLLRREGSSIWRRANEELRMGRVPARQLLDGALVMFGGALLLTPGFITDAVGLAMLFSPTRALLRPLLLGAMTRRATRVVGVSGAGSPWGGGAPAGGGDGPLHDASSRETGTPRPSARVIDVEVDTPDRRS